MLVEGVTKYKTHIRNIPNRLGQSLEELEENCKVTLEGFDKKDDGMWYICNDGWIHGIDVEIKRDIEFRFKAASVGLNLQMFATNTNLPKSINKIVSRDVNRTIKNVERNILGKAGASIARNLFGAGSGSSSMGRMGSTAVSASNKISGGKGLMGGSAGDMLKNLGNSILDDLEDLLDDTIDSILSSVFSRLQYVVGFDMFSYTDWDTDPYGSIHVDPLYGDNSNYLFNQYDYKQSDYNWWDDVVTEYFKYHGCSNQMISRTFGDIGPWQQDRSYYTGTAVSNKIDTEVAFHKQLYNADYSEFNDAVESVRTSLNLNLNRMDQFTKFNKYRLTVPDFHLTNTTAYIFFTRPDLNIMDSNSNSMASGIQKTPLAPLFYYVAAKHPNICRSLTGSLSGSHDFIPILCNSARSLDITDESIKTEEHAETLTGWKIVYARHNIESKTAGTFSVKFVDDNFLSVYWLNHIWQEYMNGIFRGIIKPKQDYIRNFILDYACSVYYFLTGEDGQRLLFWSKYVGVFPTNTPSSAFSFTEESPVRNPDFNINYAYSFKEDCNPMTLAEFNNNSSGDFSYVPDYNDKTFKCNQTMLGPAFVDTNDGGQTYKIRFRGDV